VIDLIGETNKEEFVISLRVSLRRSDVRYLTFVLVFLIILLLILKHLTRENDLFKDSND
jgi:hypothetical protein